MANTSLADMSTTPASNTTIQGTDVGEGCAPSGLNNGLRAAIAQAKGALLSVASSGTNTITATYAPVPDAYLSGWLYPFKAGGTNTGAATFNASPGGSSSAKDVKVIASGGKQALQGGEIVSGGFYVLQYDGTDMILLNPTQDEGTWTPTFAGSTTAGTQTYSVQVGRYIRQGNLVHVWFTLAITAKDATTAGNLTIGGLPFTSSDISTCNQAGSVGYHSGMDLTANYTQVGIFVQPNTAVISIYQSGDDQAQASLAASALTDSTTMGGYVAYRIN